MEKTNYLLRKKLKDSSEHQGHQHVKQNLINFFDSINGKK